MLSQAPGSSSSGFFALGIIFLGSSSSGFFALGIIFLGNVYCVFKGQLPRVLELL